MSLTAKERLREYLISNGLSKSSFYQKTDISNGYLDKPGAIGSKLLRKISAFYPLLDLHWVITGVFKSENENIILNSNKESASSLNSQKIAILNQQIEKLEQDKENLQKTIDAQAQAIKQLSELINTNTEDLMNDLIDMKKKKDKNRGELK